MAQITVRSGIYLYGVWHPVTCSSGTAALHLAVAAAIGPRTRAILGVHLFGAAAGGPREVADVAGVPLIEACAQAWLTRYPDDRLAA
jgi:dTDP-4-amino-4,6-dideoxygalactose transaminase